MIGNQTCNKAVARLGFIFAMDEEMKPFMDALKKCVHPIATTRFVKVNQNLIRVIVKNTTFFLRHLFPRAKHIEIYVCRSGIGKTNGAIWATQLIQNYGVHYLINLGTVGLSTPELNLGRPLIISQLTYHDVDATVFNYVLGQVPQMPAVYQTSEKLNQLIAETLTLAKLDYQTVELLTGDCFLTNKQQQNIKKLNVKFAAIDMEGAAIGQTCFVLRCEFACLKFGTDYVFEKHGVQTHGVNVKLFANQMANIVRLWMMPYVTCD